jgi:sugar phosphate isomerase/epimerase
MTSSQSGKTARDLGPSDLVWDHFSRPRGENTVTKIYAAAQAGYAAIGLYLGSWAKLMEDPRELDLVDAALETTGLVVANIETLRGWSAFADGGLTHAPYQGIETLAFAMADHWNCRYVQVIGDPTGSLEHAVKGFGALCDRAADHGLLVGLEWVPAMTNIDDATTALRIVEEADRPNGGLCVDSWHFTRSTNNLDDLRQIPGEKVMSTQWNDGTIAAPHGNSAGEYLTDCLENRVVPGAGEFSLVEIVTILDSIGSVAPIGIEVCSAELNAGPADEAAMVAADAMRRVLATSRG